MSGKKWIKIWFSILLLIPIFGILNYLVDPLQQYRKAEIYDVYYEIKKQRYLNPGLAKTYDYNSVLIGSSMTENFLISDLKKIMNNPIKLCMSGATANEINTTLKTVFNSKNKVDTVFLGLDLYAISGDKFRLYNGPGSMPLYLYDNNISNDYKYLISNDTIKESFRSVKNSNSRKDDQVWFEYEYMYQWQHNDNHKFGKEKVLELWSGNNKYDINYKNKDWQFDKLKESFDYNILSIVNENPNTKFIIFYPPYSILTYKDWQNKNMMEDIIKIKMYINEVLKNKNVELYDFQNNLELVSNLDLYKDNTHYHQKVNTYIVDAIKDEKYKVYEKYLDTLNQFENYVNAYEVLK